MNEVTTPLSPAEVVAVVGLVCGDRLSRRLSSISRLSSASTFSAISVSEPNAIDELVIVTSQREVSTCSGYGRLCAESSPEVRILKLSSIYLSVTIKTISRKIPKLQKRDDDTLSEHRHARRTTPSPSPTVRHNDVLTSTTAPQTLLLLLLYFLLEGSQDTPH